MAGGGTNTEEEKEEVFNFYMFGEYQY